MARTWQQTQLQMLSDALVKLNVGFIERHVELTETYLSKALMAVNELSQSVHNETYQIDVYLQSMHQEINDIFYHSDEQNRLQTFQAHLQTLYSIIEDWQILVSDDFYRENMADKTDPRDFSGKTKKEANEKQSQLFDEFFIPVSGFSFTGYKPDLHDKVVVRSPRTFSGHRTEQLLKQVATQLYAYYKQCIGQPDPVEIQCLFVQNGGVSANLYIASNNMHATKKLYEVLQDETLEDILQKAYEKFNEAELKKRSKRYAGKIQQRVFSGELFKSENDLDNENLQLLICLLNEMNVNQVNLTKDSSIDKAKHIDNSIYFLTKYQTGTKYDGRHAEEWLMDLIENFNDYDQALMYGKKRPCFTCFGRMYDSDVEHNENPGLAWKTRFLQQSPQSASNTINATHDYPAHVSKNGDTSYCTDSDSECDYTTQYNN